MNSINTFWLKSNMSGVSFASLEPYGLIAAFFAGAAYSPPACPACPDCPLGAPCNCSTGLPIVVVLIVFGFLLGVWAKSHLGRVTGSEIAVADGPTKGKGGGKGQWLGRGSD